MLVFNHNHVSIYMEEEKQNKQTKKARFKEN